MPAERPRFFDLAAGEVEAVRETPYGRVLDVFAGEGIEAVAVVKQGEEIDPGWFVQDSADVIVVVRRLLRGEFADEAVETRVFGPGQVLVLPANTRCRAYRWPRDAAEATIFVAVYPKTALKGTGASAPVPFNSCMRRG